MSLPETDAAARDEVWQPFITSLPAAARIIEITPPQAPSRSVLGGPAHAVTTVELAESWDGAFTPGSFDAAAGEFAFAEADARDTLGRLRPLLSAGSELQFAFHHPESWPVAHAGAIAVEADYLFERNRVFAALSALFSLPANAPAATVQVAGQTLHQAIAQLRQAVQSGQSQGHGDFLQTALDAVGSLLNAWKTNPGPVVAAEVGEAERQLRGYARHMQATVDDAADFATMERIAACARELGYTRVEFESATRDGQLCCWLLLLHRP